MAKPSVSAEVEGFINREVFGGASNDELLQRTSGHTSIPTNGQTPIYQFPREWWKYTWPWTQGYRLRATTFTAAVRLQMPLHRGLPPATSQPDVFDVFVVARPSLSARALTRSLVHWSVYCNGFYYHLKVSSSSANSRLPTNLEVDDFSHAAISSCCTPAARSGRPLTAYHVGQTSYSPRQIECIADWIIKSLSHYDFFASNCQHFGLCLAARIIDRGRLVCVFLGNAFQIAQWAFQREHNTERQYCSFSTGFELTRSSDQVRTWLQRYEVNRRIDLCSYQLMNLWTQGIGGLLADNPLDYRSWRRQLCFPVVTDTFPRLRVWLMQPDPSISSSMELHTDITGDDEQDKSSARQIVDYPEGFGQDDIYWARDENRQNRRGVGAFLAACDQNQEKSYHVGIAYLEPKGHAVVILRDCDSHVKTPRNFETTYKSHTNGELPDEGVRLLHIRFWNRSRVEFALVLEPLTITRRFRRYHELYCIGMTERELKHIALQSCPREHQYVINDCATFVFNFLTEVLQYLKGCNTIASINGYVEYLIRQNHVYHGLTGVLETGSRADRAFGKSGHLLAESSI
ncbi:putative PPPDE domain-containing protein [Seiridium cardinale]